MIRLARTSRFFSPRARLQTQLGLRQYSRAARNAEHVHEHLGFEPGLLEGKPYIHDHRTRPASVFIAQVPPVIVEGRIAACDGGGNPLGHPKIFINLDSSKPDDAPACGYCGLRFVRRSHIPDGHPLLKGYVPPPDADDHH